MTITLQESLRAVFYAPFYAALSRGAFGTAMFDLANLSSNGEFDIVQDEALLTAYFDGGVGPDVKRAFLAMKAASALREALWAMVSDIHLKTPGVDYRAHAAHQNLRRCQPLL